MLYWRLQGDLGLALVIVLRWDWPLCDIWFTGYEHFKIKMFLSVHAAGPWWIFQPKLYTFRVKSAYVHCGRTVIYYTYDPISQPRDAWLIYIKKFSREDFALNSKLSPPNFLEHPPIFAGNSRSTGISQLRAGKTRSKRPRSHCLSTRPLLPYMWASFYP